MIPNQPSKLRDSIPNNQLGIKDSISNKQSGIEDSPAFGFLLGGELLPDVLHLRRVHH